MRSIFFVPYILLDEKFLKKFHPYDFFKKLFSFPCELLHFSADAAYNEDTFHPGGAFL